MKKTMFIISILAIIFIAVFIGIFIFENKEKNVYESKKIEDDCTILGKSTKLEMQDLDEVSYNEEKVGPNAKLKLKKTYTDCKHIIIENVELPTEIINMNRSELEEQYKTWKLEEFSTEEIIFSREYTGICNEHYIVKILGDVLGIYVVDKDGKQSLKNKTEIYVNYLPQNDVSRLKEGIEVIGKENLNSLLEDYE